MTVALQKLAEEDPTFKTHTDEETGQTIIPGMGELHLDIIYRVGRRSGQRADGTVKRCGDHEDGRRGR